MCWVMTSTKFAVVQWASSVGGSPSTATFSTPPFLGVCARASSPVRTTRPATSSSDKLDRNPRLMANLPRDQARAVTMAGRETLVKAGSGSANGVAPATHAGGEGAVVAFLALGVVVGAAYARTADAARCRADRSARARVTRRGPDGGARGCPAHGAYQRAYTSALGAIRQRIEARLLLGPGLALGGVVGLLLGRLAFLGIDIGAGLRGRSRGAPRERGGEPDQGGPPGYAVSSVFHISLLALVTSGRCALLRV